VGEYVHIRDLLARAGLSQRGFARAIGVSEREVRYWCADRPVPRWAMICARHFADCCPTGSGSTARSHERVSAAYRQSGQRENQAQAEKAAEMAKESARRKAERLSDNQDGRQS
jgi:DNA-binding XRE family transcriptional regulator